MPQVMTKETTVYTLEELEALGWKVREKAINNVLTWEWEGWEPSWFTEDLINDMEYHAPLFELQARTRRGKHQEYELEWDLDRLWIRAKGSIDVRKFMIDRKLRNKYRALWYAIDVLRNNLDAGVQFGYSSRDDNCDLGDLWDNIEYDLTYNYEIPVPHARRDKIAAQIKSLENDIDHYVGELHSALLKYMRAEYDYRCSEEFAKEEIEAHEFKFTEDGDIYHG